MSRIERWVHPTTGAVSIVRITRTPDGFNDVEQLDLIETDRMGFAQPCQFSDLDTYCQQGQNVSHV
jgi:hypothetical protein